MRTDEQHGGPGERGGLRLGIQRQRTGNPGHLQSCRAASVADPIRMFLGLLDPNPDPTVRGMDPDPDPSVIKQK